MRLRRPTCPAQIDPAGVNEYPGFGTAGAGREQPRAARGVEEGGGAEGASRIYRALFRTKPHPMLAATLTPAVRRTVPADQVARRRRGGVRDERLALRAAISRDRPTASAVGRRVPRLVANGQPRRTAPGSESGRYVQSLACAYQLTRLVRRSAPRRRATRPRSRTRRSSSRGLQYPEANTRHFENTLPREHADRRVPPVAHRRQPARSTPPGLRRDRACCGSWRAEPSGNR